MKRKIVAIGCIIVALLLIAGPWTLFKTCPLKTEAPMRCYWTCRALIVPGLVLLVCSILQLVKPRKESFRLLALVSIISYLCAIALPASLIGGCAKMDMACRMVTFPAIYSLSVVGIVLQGIGWIGKKD